MKYLTLTALLLPVAALAQDSQTTCVNTQPVSTCTTRSTAPPPVVNAPDIAGAFFQGMREAQQRQMLEQQAELAAAERHNVELQNQHLQQQLDEHQQLVAAEAAVIRQAFVAYVLERRKLPEEQRVQDPTTTAQRIGEIASGMLGHEPGAEAIALASKQLQTVIHAP